jgi:acyl carrier protein
MATPRSIQEMVVGALAEATGRAPSAISLSDHFRHDLGLNSLDTIELMYKVEETFDLMIPDADLPKLLTVGSLIDYLQGRVPTASAGRASSPAPTAEPAAPANKPSPARRARSAAGPAAKKRSRA